MLNLPTNTGLSSSSAGFMPPLSYQGDKNARQPMGDTTLLYFLYIEATYPSPVKESQSGYIAFLEHSMPAINKSCSSFPSPWRFSSYKNTTLGNNTGFLQDFLPCPPILILSIASDAIFSYFPVPSPVVTVIKG